MSRSICITVKFHNGRTRNYGIYNPLNAEYEESRLSYSEMIYCLETAKKACKGMRLKNVTVTNQISTGDSKDRWETGLTFYPDLDEINPCKLVDANDNLYAWVKDMSETAYFFGIRDHEYRLLQGMLNNLKMER